VSYAVRHVALGRPAKIEIGREVIAVSVDHNGSDRRWRPAGDFLEPKKDRIFEGISRFSTGELQDCDVAPKLF
jgi:hypothetical protein